MPPRGIPGSLLWSKVESFEGGRRHTPQNTRPSRGRNAPVYTTYMSWIIQTEGLRSIGYLGRGADRKGQTLPNWSDRLWWPAACKAGKPSIAARLKRGRLPIGAAQEPKRGQAAVSRLAARA